MTVTIPRVTVFRSPDTADFGELYARIKIGDNPEFKTGTVSSSFNSIFPNWIFTAPVEPAADSVEVRISLFDEDLIVDEIVDINPASPKASLTLSFNLHTGQWSQDVDSPANSGRGNGDGAGDAELVFDISRSFVPVTVAVPRVTVYRSPDFFGFGNLYARIKIGDNPEQQTSTLTSSFSSFFPDWTVTDYVSPFVHEVEVRIALFDHNDVFSDGVMDINPSGSKTALTLTFNLDTATWSGDVIAPANSGRGNGNADGDAELEFSITSDVDTDGDGLLDRWEREGVAGIDLPALGADPHHKDLFIEVDSMVGRAPAAAAITMLVDAFAAAPQALVQNPDGRDGVTLHIEVDETDIPRARWPNDFSAFDVVKGQRFGTVAQRLDPDSDDILAAKARIYRYAIFADRYGTLGSSGRSRGTGSDFFITLGGAATPGGTAEEQAATFMHELGHSLGLFHGGPGDDDNWKPNYHSVMNYLWGLRNARFASSWTLDYSRLAFPDLNEDDLDEEAGIGGHAGHQLDVGPRPVETVNESGPVDWNRNHTIDVRDPMNRIKLDVTRVVADSNFDGVVDARDNTPGQILHGREDWSALQYAVACTDGGGPGPGIVEITHAAIADLDDILYYSDLVAVAASDLTLRRNGDSLEILDNQSDTVVASRPLARTRLVQILGTEETDDRVTVDFSAGGFFFVPGGIEVTGRTGGSDVLIVEAAGASVTSAAGTIFVGGAAPIRHSEMETVKVIHRGVTPVVTVDNQSWGYRDYGVGWLATAGGYQGSHRAHAAGVGANVARWLLAPGPGNYELFATWPDRAGSAGNARFQIYDGNTLVGTKVLDQRARPTDALAGGTVWQSLGVYRATTAAGVLRVDLRDDASGIVLADAVIAVRTGSPLLVAGVPQNAGPTEVLLVPELLQSMAVEARNRWTASLMTAGVAGALAEVRFHIADLPGSTLGLAADSTIWIDQDAAGHGWFIDATPADDGEFDALGIEPVRQAPPGSPAFGRVDLLTVVAHELGHILGLEDLDPHAHADDLMAATLATGVRRMPSAAETATAVLAGSPSRISADVAFPLERSALVISSDASHRSGIARIVDAAFADFASVNRDEERDWTSLGMAWEQRPLRKRRFR